MSREALKLAEDWRAKIATVARNLTDFNDSEAAIRVKGRLHDPSHPYAGRTAEVARAAMHALAGLWQDYLMVSEVVDRAWAAVKRPAILGDRDADVEALLLGPSIRLPALSIPVTKRSLLDPADSQATARPQDVLLSMIAAFEAARNAVTTIADAEDRILPRAARLRDEADALAGWAEATGTDIGDLATVDLAAMSDDPLDAAARLDRVEAALEAARTAKRAAETLAATLQERFAAADAKLADLTDMLARTTAARDECAAKIDDVAAAAPLDDAVAPALWLRTLRTTAASGRAKPAAIGLDRWDEAMATTLAAVRRAYDAARAPLDRMDDLKGRLRALRAKGAALGASGLLILESQARSAVAATPFRHDEAKRLVDAYEAALAAAAAAGSGAPQPIERNAAS